MTDSNEFFVIERWSAAWTAGPGWQIVSAMFRTRGDAEDAIDRLDEGAPACRRIVACKGHVILRALNARLAAT